MGILSSILRALFRPAPTPHQEPLPQNDFARFNLPKNPHVQALRPPPSPPIEHNPPVFEHIVIRGHCWVIDGDTIVIGKVHIRLSGIDAPELDHPYGQKAKWVLHALCKGQVITATTDGSVTHERAVAVCHLPDGRDLSAEMVRAGMALDWPKFSGGRYRHLETPDARRKLWRADARQRGKWIPDRSESRLS